MRPPLIRPKFTDLTPQDSVSILLRLSQRRIASTMADMDARQLLREQGQKLFQAFLLEKIAVFEALRERFGSGPITSAAVSIKSHKAMGKGFLPHHLGDDIPGCGRPVQLGYAPFSDFPRNRHFRKNCNSNAGHDALLDCFNAAKLQRLGGVYSCSNEGVFKLVSITATQFGQEDKFIGKIRGADMPTRRKAVFRPGHQGHFFTQK